jgi:methylamine dehydrogenase accessory protein MauD
MNTVLLASILVTWIALFVVGFLLLGTLRAVGLMSWRLDQLEVTTPSRTGRSGLKIGKKALDFTLPRATGGDCSLHDFVGRKTLLVFTQSGCGPCHEIAPELNRLHGMGEHEVVVVNNGELAETREWAQASGLRFPVLVQEKYSLSKRYEVFATPFAFLINEQGAITSKGIINSSQHLNYVLTGAGNRPNYENSESEVDREVQNASENHQLSTEVSHV